MWSWACRQLLRAAVGIVAAAFIFVPSVMAQNIPGLTVDQFLANPAQVLQQYPDGGSRMISLIRDAALKNPTALSAIIALLANATPDQQMAIGSGLGQAAKLSVRNNQAYADQIQQDLATSGNQNAIIAFSAVTENIQTTATGGGAGGGGGGFGGPTGTGGFAFGGTNFGTGQNGATNYKTSSQNYFTSSGTTPGSTTTNNSVSPH